MEILKFPHPALFAYCPPVDIFDDRLYDLLNKMWDLMKVNNGMGLAANQVGLLAQAFVMEGPARGPSMEKFFIINPTVVAQSKAPANVEEGCLSAPGDTILRSDRVEWIQIKYQNSEGRYRTETFYGIHAVCVQHEMEHLAGVSYMQSKTIPKNKRNELAKKWGLK